MPSAGTETKQPSGKAKDPVHDHDADDISQVADGLELNPKHQHPPNAETQGVWKVLRVSTLAAIVAMVVVGIVAFMAFS